jgi:hypothetical protein
MYTFKKEGIVLPKFDIEKSPISVTELDLARFRGNSLDSIYRDMLTELGKNKSEKQQQLDFVRNFELTILSLFAAGLLYIPISGMISPARSSEHSVKTENVKQQNGIKNSLGII